MVVYEGAGGADGDSGVFSGCRWGHHYRWCPASIDQSEKGHQQPLTGADGAGMIAADS